MDFSRAAKGLGAGLGESDVTNLSFLDQIRQSADSVFNRSIWVNPVLIVEVNVGGPEPLQAGIACFSHVFRTPIDAAGFRIIGIANDAEFCRNNKLVAFSANRAPNQLLILERTVHISCIEKGDTKFNSAVNGSDGFFFIAGSIEFRHAHTAQAEGGDGQAVAAKLASYHSQLLQEEFS